MRAMARQFSCCMDGPTICTRLTRSFVNFSSIELCGLIGRDSARASDPKRRGVLLNMPDSYNHATKSFRLNRRSCLGTVSGVASSSKALGPVYLLPKKLYSLPLLELQESVRSKVCSCGQLRKLEKRSHTFHHCRSTDNRFAKNSTPQLAVIISLRVQ